MEFTGKTVQEAIEEGLNQMGLTADDVNVNVIDEPVKGLFGKIKKLAKVNIEKNLTDGEKAVKFLDGLFTKLDIDAKANLISEAEQIEIEVITTSSASLIGYRGEILDSLQTLAGAVANTGKKDYRRVVVNCEGYREKREETLIKLAHRLEDKAVKLGRDVTLEPMSPYERRIIHSALSNSEKVVTKSEGKEPNRYVIIVPNEKKPQREKFDRKGGKDFKGGKKFDRKGGKDHNAEKRTEAPKKKTTTFGTFLGNSLKND
jgi:spoIIIJ-associated protein